MTTLKIFILVIVLLVIIASIVGYILFRDLSAPVLPGVNSRMIGTTNLHYQEVVQTITGVTEGEVLPESISVVNVKAPTAVDDNGAYWTRHGWVGFTIRPSRPFTAQEIKKITTILADYWMQSRTSEHIPLHLDIYEQPEQLPGTSYTRHTFTVDSGWKTTKKTSR